MGKKNCELAEDDIQRICDVFLAFEETEESKIFANEAFGYWKVRVERPLRLKSQLSNQAISGLMFASGDEELRSELYDRLGEALVENFEVAYKRLRDILAEWDEDEERPEITEKTRRKLLDSATWARDAWLVEVATAVRGFIGGHVFDDYNTFLDAFDAALKQLNIRLSATDKKAIINATIWRDESAPPVIKKMHKPGKVKPDPLHGLFEVEIGGQPYVVEYEPDSELRDYEQIPLLEQGGIPAFMAREVLPYVPDAWIDEAATRTGYEISFTRYFYKPQELRPLSEIRADIIALERETEGLLDQILNLGKVD